jgi:hypothetical protein
LWVGAAWGLLAVVLPTKVSEAGSETDARKEVIFTGGQIDLRSLLEALDGRPFQAEIEEQFTPVAGTGTERQQGRVRVDSRGRSRFDLQQEGTTIAFVHDPERGVMMVGVGDEPCTWMTTPDPLSFEAAEPSATPESTQLGAHHEEEAAEIPVRIITVEDEVIVEGQRCYRSEYSGEAERTVTWHSLELHIPIRIESVTPKGTKVYRLHNIRFEEPAPGTFPEG